MTSGLKGKTCTEEDHRSDSVGANQSNVNILVYFMSIADTEVDKEASRAIMQKIYSEFNDVFYRNWMFIQAESERRQPLLPGPTQESGINTKIANQRVARIVAKVADNFTITCE